MKSLMVLLWFAVFACLAIAFPFNALGESGKKLDYLEDLPPLLDRDLFFDDPEMDSATISPDGEKIAFRQKFQGVMNIWVKDREEAFEEARPLTDDEHPIRMFFWSRDSENILYAQDKHGDENFNLYAVDPAGEAAEDADVPESRALTDYEGVQTRVIARPEEKPEHVVVAVNNRDPALHDVYKINIQTGERELIFKNQHNITSWTVDEYGRIRFASRETPDGGTEILKLDEGELKQVYSVDFGESARIVHLPRGYDNGRVYLVTNRGDADLSRLVLFDPDSGEKELVEKDPEGEVDFGGAIFSRITDELLATYYEGDKERVYFHDDEFQKDYERIRAMLPEGDINFRSRTQDEDMWIISVSRDVDPGSVYLYDRDSGEVDLLYRSRPDLPTQYLASMEPIRYEARDGLEIPAYLTLPRGVEPKGLGLVVMPHGGPWIRDYWGYDPQAQFLANRGYAVLQPNYRGSSGFGKEFLNAGNKEWGTGYMQHDITDGVKHLIEEGVVDPDHVGIYGASYGGFAALAGLAFTPDLYAAGASMVGPSNIITLIESVPEYWKPVLKSFKLRVGDPDDPEDRQRLKEQSPLFSAENIQAPLLVAQGANDPRVPKRESDQIVAALRDQEQVVQYLVAPDEGHGFARPQNRLAFFVELERFLASFLGGRGQTDVPTEVAQRLAEIIYDLDEVEVEAPASLD
ncbi:S9 family peptidase [Desulfonatronospira sp.]|uniref:S9 family peptidase n=1 Tax=Desulfonatronospira sp. TaxID=1962951 RepID=UPI0025C50C8A|nr:S9 family peptidase [Desulfonatronospira sp.]